MNVLQQRIDFCHAALDYLLKTFPAAIVLAPTGPTSANHLPNVTGHATDINSEPPGLCLAEDQWMKEGVTTVMIQNLPPNMTPKGLFQEILARGFHAQIDFVHVPFHDSANGFGFVNFTRPDQAVKFRNLFDGQQLVHLDECTGKVFKRMKVRVRRAALQGYDANVARIQKTKTGFDPTHSPLIFLHLSQK